MINLIAVVKVRRNFHHQEFRNLSFWQNIVQPPGCLGFHHVQQPSLTFYFVFETLHQKPHYLLKNVTPVFDNIMKYMDYSEMQPYISLVCISSSITHIYTICTNEYLKFQNNLGLNTHDSSSVGPQVSIRHLGPSELSFTICPWF